MAFPYESKLPHWVNRLSFVLRAEVQQRFRAAGYDLTAEEWSMLMQLWSEAPQSTARLAERSLRDRTTVTRLLDGMVKKGLLTRTHPPEDRRRILIDLTDRARALELPLVNLVEAVIADAVVDIASDDVQVATDVLRRMTHNLVGKPTEEEREP